MTARKKADKVEQVDELPDQEEPDLGLDDGADPVDDDVSEDLQDTETPPTPLDPLGVNTYPDPDNIPHTP